ncbi:MAG TPA: class I SAM-dependent methyltransferase [Candidatus Sabulitectum sp.]|nr:class I SAM-dependent methyltransferase [Candidatus Sabulitectum sp.]HPJ29262.1 class I SAM-dependent methyltransferase [Candidatus Sabulitectum sp.]HPR23519.1 class I SAM-dependent methyltransferase [Candidatus Sabulitectum sp.]
MARDKKAEEINRKHWDEIAPVHLRSYELDSLLEGGHHLDPVQVRELGDISGKRALHLQCHIGTDTLSLARLGAEVTGIDISEESLKAARELSKKTGISARFIRTALFDLPEVLDERFDLVYTSIGVLCWISDIQEWGRIVARYLEPGGTFYLMESHPFMHVFDDETDGLKVKYRYFMKGGYIDWPGDYPDYSDEDYLVKNPTREFQWTLSEVLCALTGAGLSIEFLHEFDFLHWKGLESMVRCEDGKYRLPEPLNRIPVLFSLKAVKPG